MSGNSRIIAKPTMHAQQGSEADIERFINGAPDARAPSPAGGPVATAPIVQEPTKAKARGRKTPMSLTLSDQVIETIDRKRAALGGLSRPAFIALAVSKFEG